MKKIGILLLGIIIVMSILPLVSATWNNITNIEGNESNINLYVVNFTQLTANPKIGDNVTFVTWIQLGGDAILTNISSFAFYPPDNSTLTNETTFIVTNATGVKSNATNFTTAINNFVVFSGLMSGATPLFNNSVNNSLLCNITWTVKAPIAQSTISISKSGRAHTQTWNITSSASNVTITNASLIVEPTFWYTRIGNLTAITFNATAVSTQNYVANLTRLQIFTDLNQSSNMEKYGSGAGTLSVTYNGPTVDASSGSSPSKVTPISRIPTEISAWFTPKGIFFILCGLILIGGVIATVLYILVKKK